MFLTGGLRSCLDRGDAILGKFKVKRLQDFRAGLLDLKSPLDLKSLLDQKRKELTSMSLLKYFEADVEKGVRSVPVSLIPWAGSRRRSMKQSTSRFSMRREITSYQW